MLRCSNLTSWELCKSNLTVNLPDSYQFVPLNNFTFFFRMWSFTSKMRTLSWELDDLQDPFGYKIPNVIDNAILNSMLHTWTLTYLLASVKNHKESELLTYLQANKLVCHSIMDAGIRRQMPRSETQDFYGSSHTRKHELLICQFPLPCKTSGDNAEGPKQMLCVMKACVKLKTLCLVTNLL